MIDVAAVLIWLHLLYGEAPGMIAVVTLPGAASRFFATDRLDAAATFIADRARSLNVYVGSCTLSTRPASGRGGESDTAALVGLWADLDVHGFHHQRTAGLPLPPDRDAAFSLVADLGLAPTAVVDTGGGLQAWWLLDQPWVFTDAEDRLRAAALSSRFGATLVELGRRRKWHVDDVSDLARIMRPPGTVNRKRAPVPVALTVMAPERRYKLADVEAVLLAPRPTLVLSLEARWPMRHAQEVSSTPAEAFARHVTWAAILEPAGFTLLHEHGGAAYWHHSASTTGPRSVSATTDANGVPVLVVFSEGAGSATGLPAGAGHRLTKFRAWSILNYAGDEREAARALRKLARERASA